MPAGDEPVAGETGGLQFVIYSHADGDMRERLALLTDNVMDLPVVFAEITELLSLQEAAAFGRGKKLSPLTIANKQSYGFPVTKLVRTGALRQSLVDPLGGPGAIRLISPTGMSFGTDVWYGVFAKSGTKVTSDSHNTGEPRRYVISMTPTTRKAIRLRIMEHLGFVSDENIVGDLEAMA